jgi:hypothetical protein
MDLNKDAFISKVYVPETKGKSVLTDKKLATQIYNPRRMYVMHQMAVWLDKHPAKKNDSEAKKVISHLAHNDLNDVK